MDPHPSRNRRRFAGTIALVLGFAAVNTGAAFADSEETVITVCSSGCDHSTIQAAIDAAPAGATVEVGTGVYSEALKVDKSLRILGANSEASPNVVGAPAESNKSFETGSIITPPTGASNHAIDVSGASGTVEIAGFTVDLTQGADKQTYVRNGGASDLKVTLKNNYFRNAKAQNEGWVWFNGKLGDFEVTAEDNRFENGGASNGFRIFNGTEGAQAKLSITDNVFIDNAGWSLNNSSNGSTTGTISGNWFGNSTPKADLTKEEFGERQSGMVLAGEFDEMKISNNVLENLEAVGFNLWESISGDIEISHNDIIGHYNGADGGGVISVYQAANRSPGDVSGVVVKNNRFGLLPGATAIRVPADADSIDARLNWWGSASPNFAEIIKGTAQHDPWYTSAALDQTSDDDITVSADNPIITIESPDAPVSIQTAADVPDAAIDISALIGDDGTAVLPQITVAGHSGINLEIPAGTIVHAPDGAWDGRLRLPEELFADDIELDDGGEVDFAVSVGGEVKLLFDQPVRLTLPGQAGKDAAYIDADGFAMISDTCAASDADVDLDAEGECVRDEAGDQVILTKHFTIFLTYSPANGDSDSSQESAAEPAPKQPHFTG